MAITDYYKEIESYIPRANTEKAVAVLRRNATNHKKSIDSNPYISIGDKKRSASKHRSLMKKLRMRSKRIKKL